MLQRSIQSVLELTSRACGKLIEMDVTTKIPASWSCLKEIFQRSTWTWLSEVEKIISRLWNFCACHTKAEVTFAPTLGSHSPLPPTEVGANATPHEVRANATPVPLWQMVPKVLKALCKWDVALASDKGKQGGVRYGGRYSVHCS